MGERDLDRYDTVLYRTRSADLVALNCDAHVLTVLAFTLSLVTLADARFSLSSHMIIYNPITKFTEIESLSKDVQWFDTPCGTYCWIVNPAGGTKPRLYYKTFRVALPNGDTFECARDYLLRKRRLLAIEWYRRHMHFMVFDPPGSAPRDVRRCASSILAYIRYRAGSPAPCIKPQVGTARPIRRLNGNEWFVPYSFAKLD